MNSSSEIWRTTLPISLENPPAASNFGRDRKLRAVDQVAAFHRGHFAFFDSLFCEHSRAFDTASTMFRLRCEPEKLHEAFDFTSVSDSLGRSKFNLVSDLMQLDITSIIRLCFPLKFPPLLFIPLDGF